MSSFDATRLRRAIHQTSAVLGKPLRDVVTQAAKGFTRDIVKITPPGNQSAKGRDAKKQGEGRVTKEYARAFKPFDASFTKFLFYISGRAFRGNESRNHGEMTDREVKWSQQILGYVSGGRSSAIEKIFRDMKVKRPWMPKVTKADVDGFRNVNTGRMKASALFVVPPGAVSAALKTATAHVGILAGGWNAASTKLGVKQPAWVRRHSTAGDAKITEAGSKFTIELENSCSFISHVARYDERMAWAMNVQSAKLERQMNYAMKHGLAATGWN